MLTIKLKLHPSQKVGGSFTRPCWNIKATMCSRIRAIKNTSHALNISLAKAQYQPKRRADLRLAGVPSPQQPSPAPLLGEPTATPVLPHVCLQDAGGSLESESQLKACVGCAQTQRLNCCLSVCRFCKEGLPR